MKKTSILVCLIVLLMFSVFGCAPQEEEPAPEPQATPDPQEEAAWEIMIEGVEPSPITFTSIDADAAGLMVVELDVVMKREDGSEEQQQWRGIPLRMVLEHVGATGYTGVIVEGADGYSQEYSLEITNRAETILGLELNGEPLDEELGPVQMVPKGEPGRMFVKNLAKITVLK